MILDGCASERALNLRWATGRACVKLTLRGNQANRPLPPQAAAQEPASSCRPPVRVKCRNSTITEEDAMTAAIRQTDQAPLWVELPAGRSRKITVKSGDATTVKTILVLATF